ncbi:MAG: hypothetical protein ACI8ZM_001405 [Crocinitomix sp.]|jgi:hypothetical protein
MAKLNSNILFRLIVIFFLGTQVTWSQHDDWLTPEQWDLNGPVQTMEEYSYSASYSGDSVLSDGKKGGFLAPKSHTLQFNKDGLLFDFLEYPYDSEGSSVEHITYAYDGQQILRSKIDGKKNYNLAPHDSLVSNKYGLVIEKWGTYKDTFQLENLFSYINDSTSKPFLEKRLWRGVIYRSLTYEYDSLYRLERCITRVFGDGRNYRSEFELFDSLERVIELKTYGWDKLEETETFEYNELSQKIGHRSINVKEDDVDHEGPDYQDFYKTFHYDDSKNLIRIDHYDRDGELSEQNEYVFDHENRMLYSRHYDVWSNGQNITEEYKWEYSNAGQLILYSHKFKFMSPEFFESVAEYEYDDFDNWVKQVSYSNERHMAPYIIIRTFTYYE